MKKKRIVQIAVVGIVTAALGYALFRAGIVQNPAVFAAGAISGLLRKKI